MEGRNACDSSDGDSYHKINSDELHVSCDKKGINSMMIPSQTTTTTTTCNNITAIAIATTIFSLMVRSVVNQLLFCIKRKFSSSI